MTTIFLRTFLLPKNQRTHPFSSQCITISLLLVPRRLFRDHPRGYCIRHALTFEPRQPRLTTAASRSLSSSTSTLSIFKGISCCHRDVCCSWENESLAMVRLDFFAVTDDRNIFFQPYKAPDASEVPIGCIFVHDGIIVAKAMTRTNECMRVPWTCSKMVDETASFIGQSTRGARDRLTLTKLWSRRYHSTRCQALHST